MADPLIWAWLIGWAALTGAAAWVGGNETGPDEGLPMFFWPLFFGWFWPIIFGWVVVVALFILLGRLSDKRRKEDSDNAR